MSVLVTGATGFIGRNLLEKLPMESTVGLCRTTPKHASRRKLLEACINGDGNYLEVLQDIDTVVHLAARVHLMNDDAVDPLEEFRKVNTYGTINLARQAARSGVQRFVFISSIKVCGEYTDENAPLTFADKYASEDPYALSKAEAEKQLFKLARDTGMEVVVIRPPLVYGPGVKGNFSSLMKLVAKGIPVPFGSIINNKRSLVSVENLVDLIITCIDHPQAANEIFLVSDDHDVSTAELIDEMATALGKTPFQIPVPIGCYRLAGRIFKKKAVVSRLIDSLQVDIKHTKDKLDWTPPQTIHEGFKQTAEDFFISLTKSGNT